MSAYLGYKPSCVDLILAFKITSTLRFRSAYLMITADQIVRENGAKPPGALERFSD